MAGIIQSIPARDEPECLIYPVPVPKNQLMLFLF